MRNTLLLSMAFLQLQACVYSQQPPQKHFDGQTWWEHVKYVADDRMEGRETGSEGLRKAEAYAVWIPALESLVKSSIEGCR